MKTYLKIVSGLLAVTIALGLAVVSLGIYVLVQLNTLADEVLEHWPAGSTIEVSDIPSVNDPCLLRDVVCESEMLDPLSVEKKIRSVAAEWGYENLADELVSIAKCESGLNPSAIGGELDSFRGLYQWNRISSPDISDACTLDVECSTEMTINALRRGEQWRWPNCAQPVGN